MGCSGVKESGNEPDNKMEEKEGEEEEKEEEEKIKEDEPRKKFCLFIQQIRNRLD